MKKNKFLNFNKICSCQYIKDSIIISFLLFLIEMMVKLLVYTPFFSWGTFRIFLSSMFFGCVISYVSNFFSKRISNIINFILLFLYSIYCFIEFLLYEFFGFFMSVGNVGQGTKVTNFAGDFLNNIPLESFLILFPLFFYIIYYYFSEKKQKNYVKKKYKLFSKIGCVFVSGILIISLIYFGSIKLKFMQDDMQLISNEQLILKPIYSNLAVNQFGLGVYFISDSINLLVDSKINNNMDNSFFDKKENNYSKEDYNISINTKEWSNIISNNNKNYNILNDFFVNNDVTKKNDYTGVFKNKNLIVILMESVDMMAIDKEHFPTLYKMYNDGISFRNNYSSRSSCSTANSELSSMTGLIPSANDCSVNIYNNNLYFQSIFNVFKSYGYKTSSYHNYNNDYYSRNIYHKKLGSEKYYDADMLKIKYDRDRIDWADDLDLIKKSVPMFIDDEKFMTYLVTVTPHLYYNPGVYGEKYMDLWDGFNYSGDAKRYLSKLKHMDLAMEELLRELEIAGKLEDTVIALFSDHYPFGLDLDDIEKVLGKKMNYDTNDFDKTPMMIYNAGFDKVKVNKYTSVNDLLPTLLNLFGVEYDSRLYLGKDVFDESDGITIFSNGSWKNEYGFYDSSTSKFIENKKIKHKLDKNELININVNINRKINMNELAISENYFAYLEKELNKYQK